MLRKLQELFITLLSLLSDLVGTILLEIEADKHEKREIEFLY